MPEYWRVRCALQACRERCGMRQTIGSYRLLVAVTELWTLKAQEHQRR